MNIQRLLSLMRQSIDRYHMIESGDKIAVGVSGGKDSMTMLCGLKKLQEFYPMKFELEAITVDLGFHGFDCSPIKNVCEHLSIPFSVIDTDIGKILFETRCESNPCALCAKMRKGALNIRAKEIGCNKVAYAHHKDDLIETMFLSLIYEGRFHTFSPYTYLDRMELSVIRPMIDVDESNVIGFKNKYQLPVCVNPCPADGHTKREYAKQLLKQLERENPGARDRFYHAILTGHIDGWPKIMRRN